MAVACLSLIREQAGRSTQSGAVQTDVVCGAKPKADILWQLESEA